MTIAATYIGQSTIQITASGTTTAFADLTNAVKDAMLGTQASAVGEASGVTFAAAAGVTPQASSGWTLHDSFTSGIIFTQVFKSLNQDAVSYKNIIFRWNVIKQELNLSTCESWDAVAHWATNEAYTFFDCAPIGFRLDLCDFILSVSPRWCSAISFINNEPGCWSGVFETEREDAGDTAAAGVPCWGWISSTLWNLGATSVTSRALAGSNQTLISMPRLKSGATGINAAKNCAANYGSTSYPSLDGTGTPSFVYQISSAINKFVANGWDVTKRLMMPVKPIFDYSSANIINLGQIYGLKVLAPSGTTMSKLPCVVDEDGNYASNGVSRSHFLFNTHLKPQSATNTYWFENINWLTTNVTVNGGMRPEAMVSTGGNYYCICQGNTKLVKVNAISGASTELATGLFYDIDFDGERYVYFGTSTGLRRLDIRTDTIATELLISGGVNSLSVTPTHIVCAPYTMTATPIISRVLRSSFSIDTTYGSLTLATFTETVRISDARTDFAGNVFMAMTVAAAANFKLVKIDPTGVVTYGGTVGQVISANVGLFVLDSGNILLFHAATTGGAMTQYQINPVTMALIGSTMVGSMAALTPMQKITIAKVGGTIVAVPRQSAAASNFFTLTSLGNTITNILSAPILSSQQGNIAHSSVANGFIFTDGARLILNTEQGLRIFSNVYDRFPMSNVAFGQVAIPA
jgi:hypothetical protein